MNRRIKYREDFQAKKGQQSTPKGPARKDMNYHTRRVNAPHAVHAAGHKTQPNSRCTHKKKARSPPPKTHKKGWVEGKIRTALAHPTRLAYSIHSPAGPRDTACTRQSTRVASNIANTAVGAGIAEEEEEAVPWITPAAPHKDPAFKTTSSSHPIPAPSSFPLPRFYLTILCIRCRTERAVRRMQCGGVEQPSNPCLIPHKRRSSIPSSPNRHRHKELTHPSSARSAVPRPSTSFTSPCSCARRIHDVLARAGEREIRARGEYIRALAREKRG
ncbi:hypothetical protein C8J57DRAFT_1657794 [Mycena rebaudengoi]|nr:hypothetical protein C8J57DRAFT_1657794 [Mycena rebaudengoi]